MRVYVVNFIKEIDQSHFTMEEFAIESVSNAFAKLIPDKTLSSFTNKLPELMNLECQWEVAIAEKSYPATCHKITVGNFFF